MAKLAYHAPQGLTLEDGNARFEVKSFPVNPFADRVVAALNGGARPCDLRVDVEGELPKSLVRDFLLQSRRIKGWSVAVAGSSVRDLLLGREDLLGDIDIAVGNSTGEPRGGMHIDVYKGSVRDMRRHFDGAYNGRPFADMIHFSSPHWLCRMGDGRWVFRKESNASQYTQDYFGLLNTGEVIDPYGGAGDMLRGVIRLDYTDGRFVEDNPSVGPENRSLFKGSMLTYNTVIRGLFPQYKWGHRFHPDTERELSGHVPHFYGSDYEFEMLKRLSLWAPDTVRYISDLRRYHLIDGLREAAVSDELVQAKTPSGQAKDALVRSAAAGDFVDGDYEYVPKAERVRRFLGTLADRIRKPLQREVLGG